MSERRILVPVHVCIRMKKARLVKESNSKHTIKKAYLIFDFTMSFIVPTNTSLDEIDAIAQRGIDAMFDAYDAGVEAPTVAFLHEGTEEAEEHQEENHEDDNNGNDNGNNIPADEIEDSCTVCGHDPCLFCQHAELLLAFDAASLGDLAPEDVPANNLRRKSLYRQLTLLINGGPLGTGVRKELPKCCVDAVREMLPSDTFMGFMEV
jgi:hypothetical protein